ncbi:hypothetical protein KP509_37G057300 [Ceratopteris richardii]|nr:hypothetical protein KP509_37G057300 [Ceratopteris richardii]
MMMDVAYGQAEASSPSPSPVSAASASASLPIFLTNAMAFLAVSGIMFRLF